MRKRQTDEAASRSLQARIRDDAALRKGLPTQLISLKSVFASFQFVSSPNRYGLPAHFELHVWAWRDNPNGAFVDWNNNVTCENQQSEFAIRRINMTTLKRRLISIIGSVAVFAGTLAAQPVVVAGTGDPNTDVPAVQAAVDHGGHLVLMGHFSFDKPPTTPAGKPYARMVTVSKTVVISGSLDQNGDMPTIEGGEWPFLVDAVDARVTIQGLHFVRPRAGAIWIYAVAGLVVTGCRIESVEPTAQYAIDAGQVGPVSTAIFAGANPHPPSATQLGQPENFSGTLAFLNNDIDVGVGTTPGAQTLGIVLFNVGRSPDKEVDIQISG